MTQWPPQQKCTVSWPRGIPKQIFFTKSKSNFFFLHGKTKSVLYYRVTGPLTVDFFKGWNDDDHLLLAYGFMVVVLPVVSLFLQQLLLIR